MSCLNLSLPGTLQHQLENIAKTEGISLEEYIIYALTRQLSLAYTVHALPKTEINRQHDDFETLLKRLGQASNAEIESVLAERDEVPPEHQLSADVIERLHQQLAQSNQ